MGIHLNQDEMERLRDDEMEHLRTPKRSRIFLRLASSQIVNHEFRGQFGHPTSYAFVQFECAPGNELRFESRATWPATVSKGYGAKFERAIAEAVAGVLLEGAHQHSGCTVVLAQARYDEVGSSEAAFMKAAEAAMRSLLAGKWVAIGGPETSSSFEPLAKQCAVKGAGLQRVQLPPGNWFAPPGSNRNGSGGNKAVGAFDGKGR